MRTPRADTTKVNLPDLVHAINRLDLPSLSAKTIDTQRRAPHARQRNTRVASVATIRILLVTFSELKSHLSQMCKCHELRSFYELRRVLADKILPETFGAFEHCREVLRLRGSTDSPIASKLAQTAYAVGDCIEHIKHCVDIAMEYHELRYETIADITRFTQREPFLPAHVPPLLFSIEVTLPLRLDMFVTRASAFPDGVERLTSLAERAVHEARAKIASISSQPKHPVKPKTAVPERMKKESPRRPSVKVLRGVRVCEALTSSPRRQIQPLVEPEPPNAEELSDKPDKENSATRLPPPRQPRLPPPSKVENRRVVQTPRLPLQEVPQPRRVNSRIFRPTQIVRTQRSTLTPLCRARGGYSSRAGCNDLSSVSHTSFGNTSFGSTSFGNTSLGNPSLGNTTIGDSCVSDSSAAGPDCSFDYTLDETPLAHKSTRPLSNSAGSQLVVPRRRPHWVRV